MRLAIQVEGAHEDTFTSFLKNRITGEAFLYLKEDDFKELVPVVVTEFLLESFCRRHRKYQKPL